MGVIEGVVRAPEGETGHSGPREQGARLLAGSAVFIEANLVKEFIAKIEGELGGARAYGG